MRTKNLSLEMLRNLVLYFVEGDDAEEMHQLMASTLEKAIEGIRQIQCNARGKNDYGVPAFEEVLVND
jgi:xylulose-5-phosphate/fructose-6-phosphate phosphoketolase